MYIYLYIYIHTYVYIYIYICMYIYGKFLGFARSRNDDMRCVITSIMIIMIIMIIIKPLLIFPVECKV